MGDLSKATDFGGGIGVAGVYPWKANIDGVIQLDVLYWTGDFNAIVVDWQGLARYNIGSADSGMRPFVEAGIGLGDRRCSEAARLRTGSDASGFTLVAA